MINLKGNPYFLTEDEIDKLTESISNMTVSEKIGQLFFVIGIDGDKDTIKSFIRKYHPGGMMFRADTQEVLRNKVETIQKCSDIPLFIAANLESGGNGIIKEGTWVGNPLQIAATNKPEYAYQLGLISGYEASRVGCNMSFSPIVDIDYNFLNPITNTRTFGSDINNVLTFAKEQIKGLKNYGVYSVAKHFPGDGVDDRDQHLLSTVNSLSMDKWLSSYGKIYKTLIDDGLPSIMIGHIFQPELERHLEPSIKDSALRPASASKLLVDGWLREKLGFNGLTITDASAMIGYNVIMPRNQLLVETINAGVDMILFNKNIDEDYATIHNAISNGQISIERLDEAVLRILATKQSMKLNSNCFSRNSNTQNLSNEFCEDAVKKIARDSITLVKDRDSILPISPQKTPKVRLVVLGDSDDGGFKEGGKVTDLFKDELSKYGFDVSMYQMNMKEIFEEGVADLKEKFDLAFYVANVETASNQTTTRLNWIQLMAANAPWFAQSIPTVFVSTANPYHLYDIPYISTYINAYTGNKPTVEAVLRKMTGNEEFGGSNPVDPFCGSFQAKL